MSQNNKCLGLYFLNKHICSGVKIDKMFSLCKKCAKVELAFDRIILLFCSYKARYIRIIYFLMKVDMCVQTAENKYRAE